MRSAPQYTRHRKKGSRNRDPRKVKKKLTLELESHEKPDPKYIGQALTFNTTDVKSLVLPSITSP